MWRWKDPINLAWDPMVTSLIELVGAKVDPLLMVEWKEGGWLNNILSLGVLSDCIGLIGTHPIVI